MPGCRIAAVVRFEEEPRGELLRLELLLDELDDGLATDRDVLRQIHDAHAAGPEQPHDAVVADRLLLVRCARRERLDEIDLPPVLAVHPDVELRPHALRGLVIDPMRRLLATRASARPTIPATALSAPPPRARATRVAGNTSWSRGLPRASPRQDD
jgi:hypothetical protein